MKLKAGLYMNNLTGGTYEILKSRDYGIILKYKCWVTGELCTLHPKYKDFSFLTYIGGV